MALGRSEEIRQRVELVLHGIGIWTPGDCGSTDACGRVILRGAPAGFKYSATGHPGLRHGRHRARHPADPHLGITLHPTGESTAQQARNLITDPGDQAGHVKFMIRDRGPDFTAALDASSPRPRRGSPAAGHAPTRPAADRKQGTPRLLSSRRRAARSNVSAVTMAGTAISIHSSRGRSTVLEARGVVQPSRRARR
jgi:hypothetical protein